MAEKEEGRKGLAVSAAESGQKLMNFLRRRIDAPEGDLHRWIRSGQVRVNGSRAKAFDRLDENSIVRVPPFALLLDAGRPGSRKADSMKKNGTAVKRPLPPSVYEDDDVLVLAKPAGLPVQGGTGHTDSIASRLASERAEAVFVPSPVHRLDRDTSGLLVVGKTYASVRFLTDAFAGRNGRTPRKEYLAWIEGSWKGGARELTDYLANSETEGGMIRVSASEADACGAREARSIVRPLERRNIGGRVYTLVLVRLKTGRKHQIRVQLSGRGHPVVGDRRYGSGGELKLHAWRIILPREGKDDLVLELMPAWDGDWRVEPFSESDFSVRP